MLKKYQKPCACFRCVGKRDVLLDSPRENFAIEWIDGEAIGGDADALQ